MLHKACRRSAADGVRCRDGLGGSTLRSCGTVSTPLHPLLAVMPAGSVTTFSYTGVKSAGCGGEFRVTVKPVDAARWLIAAASDDGQALTNFQIQKLLYYAHGDLLATSGTPLISEHFEAWDHGPVCPTAYRAFSDFGSGVITNVAINRDAIASRIDDDALAALERAWSDYGNWSFSELWDDVHWPGSPWDQVRVPGEDHTAIPDQAIKRYFADLQPPKLRRSMNKLNKRRRDRGEVRRNPVGDAGIVGEIDDWSELRAAGTSGLLGEH